MSKQTGKKKRKKGRSRSAGPDNHLTRNENKFILKYIEDFNGTVAVRHAYPNITNDATAAVKAHRLLRKDKIKDALKDAVNMLIEEGRITKAMIARELGRIGFSNMRDYAKWGPQGVEIIDSATLSDMQAAAISEISETVTESGSSRVSFKLHSKGNALKTIGQLGDFIVDRHIVEHTGRDGGPMQWANMPPMPKSIEEWEAQIRAAEAARQKSEEPDGILDTTGGTAS